MIKRPLTYRFAKPDPRDFKYSHILGLHAPMTLPPAVDLRPLAGVPYDQALENSCTANAGAKAKEMLVRGCKKEEMPSRQFLYYVERALEGDPGKDQGADLRDTMEVMLHTGICAETIWPYTSRNLYNAPTQACYVDAKLKRIGAYYQCQTEYQIKHSLAQGKPVTAGIFCPAQMMDEKFNGVLENITDGDILFEDGQPAGHAVLIVGYEGDYFWICNSWGPGWGLGGFFKAHRDFLLGGKYAADFYTPRLAGQGAP